MKATTLLILGNDVHI